MGSIKNSLDDTIEWDNSENHILLNPRWPQAESRSLYQLALHVSEKRQLQGHIWLATSGSTSESVGRTKLVALSKDALRVSARSVNSHLQVSSKDLWLQILPRFHVGGLGVEARAQLSQSSTLCDFEKWDPQRLYKIMKDAKITLTSMVPTQIFDLIQAQLPSPSHLRAVIVGGGALNESLYHEARKLGWPLLPSYGMTETCSQIATASLQSLKSGEMPLPLKLEHVDWRLNPQGQLQVRSKSLLTCYAQNSAEGMPLDWDPKEAGWLSTEDFVELQGSSIRFLGRQNDFIKIGGESSSMAGLREIFARLVSSLNPLVQQQFLLVDAPSERLGVEIHLVTTLDPQKSDLAEMISQLEENFNRSVLPFERIREVKYTSHIPRSDLGKILWTQLKREIYGR